jgi:hypothetical protein
MNPEAAGTKPFAGTADANAWNRLLRQATLAVALATARNRSDGFDIHASVLVLRKPCQYLQTRFQRTNNKHSGISSYLHHILSPFTDIILC